MKNLSGIPFFEMQFKKNGTIYKDESLEQLLEGLKANQTENLVVISHGWNNDMEQAAERYNNIFKHVSELMDKGHVIKSKYAILGIYWPSKKFADAELIPGEEGAAGIGDLFENVALSQQLNNLADFFDDPEADAHLEKIKVAIENDVDDDVYDALFKLFQPISEANANQSDIADGTEDVKFLSIKDITAALEIDEYEEIRAEDMGGAASTDEIYNNSIISGVFKGIKSGFSNVLNLATYYQMKNRAGITGTDGLNPVLKQVQHDNPNIKIHLIGHSFGARLVTASVAGKIIEDAVTVQSLTLLQAAFSHFSFTKNYDGTNNGLFSRIIDDRNIIGPIVISHTRNDKAVGIAYALASRIAKQVAAAVGDKNDIYGGLGSNGAQKVNADETYILGVDTPFVFSPSIIYNLKADNTIKDHSDIENPEVARLIYAVIATM